MMKYLIAALLLLLASTGGMARTKTTQKSLRNATAVVEMLPPADTTQDSGDIDSRAVTLRGYSKRASDAKESFFVTNNTRHRLSHITLLMRYTSMTGAMLHERQVTIPVSLRAGESQLVAIKSWDVQKLFYYYAGPKPRKSATAYRVAFRLMGYDIPVGI